MSGLNNTFWDRTMPEDKIPVETKSELKVPRSLKNLVYMFIGVIVICILFWFIFFRLMEMLMVEG